MLASVDASFAGTFRRAFELSQPIGVSELAARVFCSLGSDIVWLGVSDRAGLVVATDRISDPVREGGG